MIKTIFAQTTRPAGELPRYCYILTNTETIPVRIGFGKHSGQVLALVLDGRPYTVLRFSPTDIVTALVPDSWENARLDIEFDLMQRGAL